MSLKNEKALIWSMIFLYIVVFGVFSCMRHYNFQTQAFDMGIFNQSFWNTIHGHFMDYSFEEILGIKNHFAMHWSPILILLVPGYAVFPSPYFLIIVQTLALALGAWPLYLLAKKVLGENKKWALLISAAYLIFPSLHWVNNYDFHELSFLVPLLIAAFYFIEKQNWWLVGLFSFLAASVKEDAILIAAFVGLYLLIKKNSDGGKQRKIGLIIFILTITYFIIAAKIFMPAFGGGIYHLSRYAYLGDTPSQIIGNLFSNPGLFIDAVFSIKNLSYIFWLLLPLAFLPVFSGRMLIILLPGLAENLLSSWGVQSTGMYQYDALLIAGLFVCLVYGLKNVLDRLPAKEKSIRWALIVCSGTAFILRSPISPINFPVGLFEKNSQWETYREIVSVIPDKASVSAQTNIAAHLSGREKIYMLGTEPEQTDIVIIDGADLSGFADEQSLQNYADKYMNSGNYNYSAIKERYFIFINKSLLK
ncbi:MAG: DUF2079 domain-containing protein [Candidatus Pacebacteria bacterium]|nr:DUF2079 domain-containing protein [Candidatus Paceibacterota bacterium]